MKAEQNYDFRKRMICLHKQDIRNKQRKCRRNEFEIKDGMTLSIAQNAGDVISIAANDFADFLKVSMGVSVTVVTDAEADITVALAKDAGVDLGEFAAYKGFLVETKKDGISIYAHDDRGAAQALFYIEDLMTFAKAPVLEVGKINKKAMFSPQMVHSGYGLDEFPDEYLLSVAHEGRDAILVFTKGANEAPNGYLDFNELIARAAKYGIDVYAYSYMKSLKHPSDPDAEEFYEGTYGKLFRECPGLKGVTFVGESISFPSKDPNISTKGIEIDGVPSGIPTGKPGACSFPCSDYPEFLSLIKKIIDKYKPGADLVFWTYNWGYQPEEDRIKLINSLPDGITLQATFEMCEKIEYEKTNGRVADYTLSFAGPGYYFESEAAAAKKKGIRLYSMTNTGGRTWDFGLAPYEPMAQQWIRRYKEMANAHDKWGLCGIMECHHYGFTPSFISKLSKHCFMEPRVNPEEMLKTIISAEFGEDNCNAVYKALDLMSEAIRHYIPSDADQYGAFRLGPAYPLNGSYELHTPASPDAMFGGGICHFTYLNVICPHRAPLSILIHDELKSLEKMLAYMNKALEVFGKIKNKNEELEYLINLSKYLRNCVVTGINAKKWYMMKCRMNVETSPKKLSKLYDEMEALLKDEMKNAEDTLPLVQMDSSLGFEPSMLYMGDEWHIKWKIEHTKYILRFDIERARQSLTRLGKIKERIV